MDDPMLPRKASSEFRAARTPNRLRKTQNEKKKQRFENLKNILFERESKRWERMDYDYLKNENKVVVNKEKNLVGRKNNPGMAFNPLTLAYDSSVQGEILKNRDDMSKYRAVLRSNNIDKHFNSNYNVLTGEDRNGQRVVERPKQFSHM